MTLKEKLLQKIELDRLVKKLISTTKEPPGNAYVEMELIQKLLTKTDFQHQKARKLDLYSRPHDGEILEILVYDMELPIYHSTIADVAVRKNASWHEIFDLKYIKKIMFDKDVVVHRGKESIQRLKTVAYDLLQLTYTKNDLDGLVNEAFMALESKSLRKVQESLSLFFELVDFKFISIDLSFPDFSFYAMSSDDPLFEFKHIILFDEENIRIGLRKGSASIENEKGLEWINQFSQNERSLELNGIKVFEFLAELALEKLQDFDTDDYSD